MEYIALLGLMQKNVRKVQTYRYLAEGILPLATSFDDLVTYLREHEELFFQEFVQDPAILQDETLVRRRLHLAGVKFTHPGEAHYPLCFLNMPGAPLLLSYVGHPCWNFGKSLAVVGSRDASKLSQLWMEESFAEFLQKDRAVIVSGGARGVDQLAHQLALRNHCPTIVALPSGLGQIYPKNIELWQKRIVDGGGCLLSEYPYHQPMLKHFFHDRNRLIAGLGVLTLLVEARRRSGSLLTAQKTLQLGKSVLVVPGHPSDSSHLGNLDLLFDGATSIRDAQDLSMYFRSECQTTPTASPIASELYPL